MLKNLVRTTKTPLSILSISTQEKKEKEAPSTPWHNLLIGCMEILDA